MRSDRRRIREVQGLLLFGFLVCSCGSSERATTDRGGRAGSAGASTSGSGGTATGGSAGDSSGSGGSAASDTGGGGSGGAPVECPPVADDPIAGTAGVFDAAGCDIVGSIVLPGAADRKSTRLNSSHLGSS